MGETQIRREITLSGPLYIEDGPGAIDLPASFGRPVPVVLDIGAARARYFLNVAPHMPGVGFVGIEIKRKRVEFALRRLSAMGLADCRMILGDASEVLRDRIAPGSCAAVTLLFPDPWPKKRHEKRRIYSQPAIAALMARALMPGGLVLVKTDAASYFQGIAAALASQADLRASDDLDVALPGLAPFSLDRPEETKYEAEFRDEGRAIYRCAFRKIGPH